MDRLRLAPKHAALSCALLLGALVFGLLAMHHVAAAVQPGGAAHGSQVATHAPAMSAPAMDAQNLDTPSVVHGAMTRPGSAGPIPDQPISAPPASAHSAVPTGPVPDQPISSPPASAHWAVPTGPVPDQPISAPPISAPPAPAHSAVPADQQPSGHPGAHHMLNACVAILLSAVLLVMALMLLGLPSGAGTRLRRVRAAAARTGRGPPFVASTSNRLATLCLLRV